jgi:hypothetical protein
MVYRGGGLAQILPQLAVLLLFAAALLSLAVLRFRRLITRGSL